MRRMRATIQFTSACLANDPGSEDNVDRFDRDNHDRVIIRPNCLEASIHKSLAFVPFKHISSTDVIIAPELEAGTAIWDRTYSSKGQRCSRTHETIPQGSKCVLELAASEAVEPGQLEELLTAMGRFVGISPFGHNMGFGRFSLINLEHVNGEPE